MSDLHLQYHLINLAEISADDFDQRNVAAVNFGDRAEWLEGLKAKTLVTIDETRPKTSLEGVLQLEINLRHGTGPVSAFFDVVFLTFEGSTQEEVEDHIQAALSIMSPAGVLVVDAKMKQAVSAPSIAGFDTAKWTVSGGWLRGRLARGSRDHTETEHVRLQYPMAIKPRWTLDRPNAPIKHKLDSRSRQFVDRMSQYKRLMPQLENISPVQTSETDPFWNNGWFPMLDGIALYSETVLRKPDIYFEIGSGNSTKFVRKAIKDFNLKTQIVSVDPAPRADIDVICDEIFRVKFEDMDVKTLLDLRQKNVFLFMDGSHYSFPNSDVNLFLLEILPQVPHSWLVGVHDIIWPYDYINANMRFYNEQYVLAPFLLAGGIDAIFPAAYMTLDPSHSDLTAEFLSPIASQKAGWAGGACFLFENRL